MSRRRRRPAEPPHHPGKQLTLNEIKFSSCESLKFPYDLACEFCKPKLCIHSNTRQSKKTFRTTTDRNRCDQIWHERWTKGKDATEGKIKKHIATRNYLRISVEVSLEEISYDSLYLSRRKLPSGASFAPPDNGILKPTDIVESARTSSHASTTLAVGSEPIGSRMLVTGVVEIDDFTTSAAL